MITVPRAFVYERPASVSAVLDALAGVDATILAGGTDLVAMRANGMVDPTRILDIKHVAELGEMSKSPSELQVGSTITMATLAQAIGLGVDAVVDGARVVGSAQIRNRATIGGNIARASPAGDTLPALLVHGARLRVAGATGIHEIRMADFFRGPGVTALADQEMLTTVTIPRGPGASAYARFTYRAWMDLAVVGVAVRLVMDGRRCAEAVVALGGAAPTPILVLEAGAALVGTLLSHLDVATAADLVRSAARPIDDVRGSAAYRRSVIGPLTERVISRAAARAYTSGS